MNYYYNSQLYERKISQENFINDQGIEKENKKM